MDETLTPSPPPATSHDLSPPPLSPTPVLSPYSAEDARGLTKAAIRYDNPVCILENELLYGTAFPISDEALGKDFTIPLGKLKVERAGSDVTIVTFSRMVGHALEAAKLLEAQGVSAEVLNLRSLRPLDREGILRSVKKTHRLVTLEEGWPTAGVGAEVAALINDVAWDELDAPPERLAGADVPMPYAINLEKSALPQIPDVVAACLRTMYRKK
jgi:pyruvate dehydrogenase E1 component beta subunit